MQNALSTLLGPILVLWVGALIFYVLDRFLKPQDAGLAETVVLLLATGLLLVSRSRVDTALPLVHAPTQAEWPGSSPFLRMDRTAWVLATIVLTTAMAAALASLGQRVRGRAGRTAALGATLLLLSAGDWATLALAWVLVDVALLYTLVSGGSTASESDQEAARRCGLAFASLGGAVLLGSTLTLWQLSGGDLAGTAPPPWPIAGLAMVAALLRLLPWPLPSYRDLGPTTGSRPLTPLARVVPFVASTLSGACLWARMGARDSAAEGGRWLAVLSLWAGLALLVSALRAWSARGPQQLIEWTAPYGAAMCLLAGGLGLPTQWQLLIGASVLLNVCALYVGWTQCQYLNIGDPHSYWRVAPTGLALLSLAGLPLTLGFPARAALYTRVFDDSRWLVLALMLAGETGMLGALLRVLLDVECMPDSRVGPDFPVDPNHPVGALLGTRSVSLRAWLQNVGYGGALILTLGIVILGLLPGLLGVHGLLSWFRLPRLPIWAALLLPAVGAMALYRSQERLTGWLDEWWPVIQRLFDLRWAARAVARGAHLVATIVWGASQVVEGAGYMAWVLLICLIVFLYLRVG